MKNFNEVYKMLRRKNWKQYGLLAMCTALSTMLITAYLTIVNSHTVLNILPEGGDSRKQMVMILALAIIGCIVFVNYAASLFFKYKSRETGIFLALGASKAQIKKNLTSDVATTIISSAVVGLALGTPLAYGVWSIFRKVVIDSKEMVLNLDPITYLYASIYTAVVVLLVLLKLSQFIKRTNIIDIVNEGRKSEVVKDVPKWFGVVGIIFMALGGFLGLNTSSFIIRTFHFYAPGWMTAPLYIPLFLGLYMVMLHTVVNGWSRRKKYKNIVSTSIMKFEGRQTVKNMVVVTLLIAGAYFATFYTPLFFSSSTLEVDNRQFDYSFNYRNDQDMIDESAIYDLAKSEEVIISDYNSIPISILAIDGEEYFEEEDNGLGSSYYYEYNEELMAQSFISETTYNEIMSTSIDIPQGMMATIGNYDGGKYNIDEKEDNIITNMVTGEKLNAKAIDLDLKNSLLLGYRVLDDMDFNKISKGLTPNWEETQVLFNVADVDSTYNFANLLFKEIINHSDENALQYTSWDPVEKITIESRGETYDRDMEIYMGRGNDYIRYEESDSMDFKIYWKYMPKFRIMDTNDFLKNTSVFTMTFAFIAIICFAAVAVITYTRSLTVGINNARVFEDLKRLGGNNAYLRNVVRTQISKVFFTPISVGSVAIVLFYTMILYTNDSINTGISSGEFYGLFLSLGMMAVISLAIYALYRFTYRKVINMLNIPAK